MSDAFNSECKQVHERACVLETRQISQPDGMHRVHRELSDANVSR